jgi:hypothetical protein
VTVRQSAESLRLIVVMTRCLQAPYALLRLGPRPHASIAVEAGKWGASTQQVRKDHGMDC